MYLSAARIVLITKLINFFLFQSVWLVTVLGAARGLTFPAIIALIVFIIVQIIISPMLKADIILMFVSALLGLVCDTAILQSGLLRVTTEFPLFSVAPFWMLVLWANLALAINHSLSWLKGHYELAAFFGAIGGPAAYLAGVTLGAAELGVSQAYAVIPLSILWAVVTPFLVYLGSRLQKKYQTA